MKLCTIETYLFKSLLELPNSAATLRPNPPYLATFQSSLSFLAKWPNYILGTLGVLRWRRPGHSG